MIKCSKCQVDSSMYRATVWVCPKCHDILNAEKLIRLLEELGISERTIKSIKGEIVIVNL